jgi:2-iminobutanoate/2-iminopropanoate deaminase
MFRFALFLLLLNLAGPALAKEKKVLVAAERPESPLSPAVQAGGLVFFSGQLGLKPGTRELVPGGIGPETRQTLENIKRVVEQAGSAMEQIAKCTVFLVDIGDFAAMNEEYKKFFPKDPPARSTVAVAGLVLGAKIEIECLGVVSGSNAAG